MKYNALLLLATLALGAGCHTYNVPAVSTPSVAVPSAAPSSDATAPVLPSKLVTPPAVAAHSAEPHSAAQGHGVPASWSARASTSAAYASATPTPVFPTPDSAMPQLPSQLVRSKSSLQQRPQPQFQPLPLSAEARLAGAKRLPPVVANVAFWSPEGQDALGEIPSYHEFSPAPYTPVEVPSTMWGRTKAGAAGFGKDVVQDYRNFYSWENMGMTAGVIGVAATLANSDADDEVHKLWQEDVRNSGWDDFSSAVRDTGEGKYVIAASFAAAGVGALTSHTAVGHTVGEWGQRSTRGLLVGAPALLIMQRATGGSRPGETTAESDWVPMADSNGASGHAFMGAVPFLSAAQMTDNKWAAASLYACAGCAGVSRINDDVHYASQVLLGWWLAYTACSSVDETEDDSELRMVPVPTGSGLGLGVQWQR